MSEQKDLNKNIKSGINGIFDSANSTIREIKKGNVSPITLFFFQKHLIATSIIFLLSFSYIAVKIGNMLKKEEIIALKQELNSARTESIRACSDFKKEVREANVVERANSMHLNLKVPNQPPYKMTGKK